MKARDWFDSIRADVVERLSGQLADVTRERDELRRKLEAVKGIVDGS